MIWIYIDTLSIFGIMKNRVWLIVAILSLVSVNSYAKQRVYKMRDFGVYPNKTENVSELVQSAIKKIKSEVKPSDQITIQFEEGDYHFHEEGSFTKTYYISNHDQVNPKQVGIALEEFSNLTLDGNGASFLFHGRMLPISLLNSTNTTLKDFSVDFVTPHIAQVQVIDNKGEEGLVVRVAPWVNYRITDKGVFETYGEGWTAQQTIGIAFDAKTKQLVYNTSDLYFNTSEAKDLGNREVYLPKWVDKRLVNSTVVAMRTWYRPTPGIFMSHNTDTKLHNVKVHYAEGMGLLAQLCENIELDEFSVCLRGEDDPRYFTTQADATHFSSCKGKLISKNGLYEGMMDDAINVHGTYLKVVRRIDDHTLIGKYMHPQAFGFDWGFKGNKVQFVKSETMELVGQENKVTSILPYDKESVAGAKEFIIEFEKPIDSQISEDEGFGIENLTWTPEVVFANSLVRNNRARGTLFSTPKKTIVENNFFDHTSGTAILLCGDCNGWFETGACRNVIIRNNRFKNALTNQFQFTNAIISIYPEIPNLEDQKKYFHGGKEGAIRIENNVFETFDKPILYAKSVDGIVFKNNIIKKNNDFPAFHWNKEPFLFERVINAVIEDNITE